MGVFQNQASPERSTRTQQKEFQSNILDGVMEHLLAADVLLGQHKILIVSRNLLLKINDVIFRMINKTMVFLSFAALVHSGEDASLPLSSGGSYQILVNNVFYFTQRVVDKLWQGMFNKDSKLVVDFIVQLIGQVLIKELPP